MKIPKLDALRSLRSLRSGHKIVSSKQPFDSIESVRRAWEQGLLAAAQQQAFAKRLPDIRPESNNFITKAFQDLFFGPKLPKIVDNDLELKRFFYPTETFSFEKGAVATNRGRSFHENEDRFAVLEDLAKGVNVYAVFDGHGSEECAEFCSERIKELAPALLPEELTPVTVSNYLNSLMLWLDNEFLPISDGSGSTVVLALQLPSFSGKPESDLVIANVGDSRGIFLPLEGDALQLTEDADPLLSHYEKEINERGGSVYDGRVQGRLRVARSVGDWWSGNGREKIINSAPTLTYLERPKGTLLLTTDGITEVATAEEMQFLLEKRSDLSAEEKATLLIQAAFSCDSVDNLTALCVNINY
jgi:serine/threonine protein phosphatase PrpC